MWALKSRYFGDKNWDREIGAGMGVATAGTTARTASQSVSAGASASRRPNRSTS